MRAWIAVINNVALICAAAETLHSEIHYENVGKYEKCNIIVATNL